MATKIQIRRDTAANWTTNSSTVLAAGEIGFETDTGKFKIGNGSSTWANLKYATNITATLPLTYNNTSQTVALNYGSGLTLNSTGSDLTIRLGTGLTFDASTAITTRLGSGLTFSTSSALTTKLGSGLTFDASTAITTRLGSGLTFDASTAITTRLGSGLTFNNSTAITLNASAATVGALSTALATALGTLVVGTSTPGIATALAQPAIDQFVLTSGTAATDQIKWAAPSMIWLLRSTDATSTSNAFTGVDANLRVLVEANSIYEIEYLLSFTSASATPNARYAFSAPTGTVVSGLYSGSSPSTSLTIGTTVVANNAAFTSGTITIAANAIVPQTGSLLLTMPATGGTAGVIWSQATTNATSTVLRRGSWIRYRRLV